MFKQLATMLKKGDTVSVTIAPENETQLRVNVYPKLFTLDGEKGPDRAALNQPLTVTGTAAELDAGFAEMLSRFTASVTGLRTTLDEAEAAHKEAAPKPKAKPAVPAKAAAKPAPKAKDESKESTAGAATGSTMDLLAEEPEPVAPAASEADEGDEADEAGA